jgi:uncharacterized integral membrane protein (TIGR00698 family)
MTRLRWLPGLALAAGGATAGYGVHLLLPGLPWLTAALILGVIVGAIPPFRRGLDGSLAPGLTLAGHRVLRLGIVVLGLKLSLVDIARLGWVAILSIVALVAASFGITWLVGRLFRLEGDQVVLMAAGFSICGVSAVGAMAAARRSPERDTGTPITLVTLYGTLAIVVLPAISSLLHLDDRQFGHWVGASVHDVGQVVATAQTAGAAALAVAVVVKLTRVLMLAPIVAIASIQTRRRDAGRCACGRGRPAVGTPRHRVVWHRSVATSRAARALRPACDRGGTRVVDRDSRSRVGCGFRLLRAARTSPSRVIVPVRRDWALSTGHKPDKREQSRGRSILRANVLGSRSDLRPVGCTNLRGKLACDA